MQVRLGWSGEIEPNVWRKADVTMDDFDLDRLLTQAGLPSFDTGALSTKVCFQLLQAEAELLLMGKLMNLGYPKAKASAKILQLEAENTHILKAIKAKFEKVPA